MKIGYLLEAQILSISENTARQNLNPIEEGQAYANYLNIDFLQLLEKPPSRDNPSLKDLSQFATALVLVLPNKRGT